MDHRIPAGDTLPRYCCAACGAVFYQNPRNIVGTLPVWEERVLLCRRAIEPRRGKWTLPAGFLENGETLLRGALRETLEEAGARVSTDPQSLYTLFNLPHINQVHCFFRARLLDLDFAPGVESLEVRLFSAEEIPWDEIAFPVVRSTLMHYLHDRQTQVFPVRMFDMHLDENRTLTTDLVSISHEMASTENAGSS